MSYIQTAGSGGGGGGITNSAGANVVTKSDGTNLVASSISDNGTTVTSAEGLAFSGASGAATTVSTSTVNANLILAPNGTGAVNVPAGTTGSSNGLTFGAATVGLNATGNILSVLGNAAGTELRFYNGATLLGDIVNAASSVTLQWLQNANGQVVIAGLNKTQTTFAPSVLIGGGGGNNGNMTATSGTTTGVSFGKGSTTGAGNLIFAPTSGTAAFVGVSILPQINQTGGASGTATDLFISATETALGGLHNLIDAGVGGTGGVFTVTNSGLIQSGMTKFVTANFTTSGVGTALEAITGLSITVPAVAANWKFHAHLAYSQAVGNAAVGFGIQAVTNNPTNIFATGEMFTAAGTVTTGVLATLATTTATQIVSGTPGATATNLITDLYGTCELGASANTIRLSVSTATAADLVTILRGSYFSFCP